MHAVQRFARSLHSNPEIIFKAEKKESNARKCL
jgi:hypothetical protein